MLFRFSFGTPAQQTYYCGGWGDWTGKEREIFNSVLSGLVSELYFLDSERAIEALANTTPAQNS